MKQVIQVLLCPLPTVGLGLAVRLVFIVIFAHSTNILLTGAVIRSCWLNKIKLCRLTPQTDPVILSIYKYLWGLHIVSCFYYDQQVLLYTVKPRFTVDFGDRPKSTLHLFNLISKFYILYSTEKVKNEVKRGLARNMFSNVKSGFCRQAWNSLV